MNPHFREYVFAGVYILGVSSIAYFRIKYNNGQMHSKLSTKLSILTS